MMKKIEDITKEKILWNQKEGKVFYTSSYEKEHCYLRMNNFPEEVLFTFFFYGETLEIDDAPTNWTIDYSL